MQIKRAVALCLFLASCASTATAPTERALPPPSLTTVCQGPVRLPEREMSGAETEVLWGRDRAALLNCRSRHTGLVEWANADSSGYTAQ